MTDFARLGDDRSASSAAFTAPGSAILAFGTVVLRGFKTVLAAVVVTVAVAMAVTLLLPPTYVTGTLLVPFVGSQPRTQFALSQLPGGLGNLVGSGSSASERLIGVVLGSRSLSDSLIARVAHGATEQREVVRILQKGLRTQRNPDGSIVIETRSRDPQLGTRVANAFPPLVNAILARVSAEGALRKQVFLRTQLDTATRRLSESQQRLLDFQRRRGAPDPTEQARRTIDAASQLQATIYQQELIVAQLRRTATAENPQLRAAVAELEARRGQLRTLTTGRPEGSLFVSIGAGPELKAASTRFVREYGQDEGIYQSLTAALAEAQIDANNDLPVLTVLDQALVPSRPARSLPRTAVLSGLLGTILGVGLVLAAEVAARLRANPANQEFFRTWDQLTMALRRQGRPGTPAARDIGSGR